MRDRRTMWYRIILPALILFVVGCGEEGETDAPVRAEPATGDIAAETECHLPDGLLQRYGAQRQLVLNLAQAEGRNRASVEAIGTAEPATFRSVADALDEMDLSSAAANSPFDAPDDVVHNLRQTADLLEAALATSGEGGDPGWKALAEFYTQERFVRLNASVGYYLNAAGCE